MPVVALLIVYHSVRNIVQILLFFFVTLSIEAKLPTYSSGVYPSNYWQFWVFYEKEWRKGQKDIILRPFYSNYEDELSAHKFNTSLYPLYYSEQTNHWSKWTFLFVFSHDSTLHDDTGDDSDLVLSPLFQWGRGETDKDRYVAFFPFFGKMKSKLSWGEINFFLFPLYVDWNHKEFKARSIFYPLLLWGSSDIRSEQRFLPFFSKKSHIAKFEHYSVFWPLLQWGRDSLDKKEPTSFSFLFPIYNIKSSQYGNMKSHAFLWIPLLGSLVGYGYDKRTSEVNYNFLFFLMQYGYSNSKDYRKHIFFPFYGYSRFASKEFTFITPFFVHMRSDTYGVKSNSYYLIPFFYYKEMHYIKEERADSYYKVWPIFKWHRDAEGNLFWNTLSLFPIRSTTLERIWDPFVSIIEYKKFINGEKRLSLMMRSYTQRWTEDELHIYVPFLLDLSLEKEKTSWKFLYGFLGYERIEEKRHLQVLWFISI